MTQPGLRIQSGFSRQRIRAQFFFPRHTRATPRRLPALAAQLVRLNVGIILATNPSAAHAAKKLTKTIPIIVTAISDPVGSGLVKSLGQPGGNVTGVSYMSSELHGKRLEVLSEIIPRLSRVAILTHIVNSTAPEASEYSQIQVVAQSLGVQLQILNVQKPDEIENAFSSMVRGKAGAVAVIGGQGGFKAEGMHLTHTGILGFAEDFSIPVVDMTNEDQSQIERFLERHRDARRLSLPEPHTNAQQLAGQILRPVHQAVLTNALA